METQRLMTSQYKSQTGLLTKPAEWRLDLSCHHGRVDKEILAYFKQPLTSLSSRSGHGWPKEENKMVYSNTTDEAYYEYKAAAHFMFRAQ